MVQPSVLAAAGIPTYLILRASFVHQMNKTHPASAFAQNIRETKIVFLINYTTVA